MACLDVSCRDSVFPPSFASPGLRCSVAVPIRRMKFEKAMVRVKGAVQPVRKREAKVYGGEATGIKTKVAKSRRL